MRFARIGVLVCFLLFTIPGWAQQTSQPTPQSSSDPQAVAVVQAAITALGGATAINQAKSWTFQAQMQGPHANGSVDYMISTHTDRGKLLRADGTMTSAPPIQSHFLPALVGAILLKESQDSEFSLQFVGTSTVDSKPVTVIAVTIIRSGVPAQIWTFDAANLPILIDFRLPAEIGAKRSVHGVVGLSDYQPISGVLHPFQIISFLPGKPPEIITIQSGNANATAPPNEYKGEAGDL